MFKKYKSQSKHITILEIQQYYKIFTFKDLQFYTSWCTQRKSNTARELRQAVGRVRCTERGRSLVYIYIYIYIYRERERCTHAYINVCIYIYIYIYIHMHVYKHIYVYVYT